VVESGYPDLGDYSPGSGFCLSDIDAAASSIADYFNGTIVADYSDQP
jgi:hypothetical protein